MRDNPYIGGESLDYAKHLVRVAVRGSMHVEQYNTSAQFKHRMDMLERFLAMALPTMPVGMTGTEELVWVRRMVEVLAEEAAVEEQRVKMMEQAILYGPPIANWPGEER